MNKYIKLVVEMLNFYDLYNSNHSEEVARLSVEVGKQLKMSENDLLTLETAAFLHDSGKLLLEDEVLNKPGKLNKDERKIIEAHPTLGANLLKKAGFDEQIIKTVKDHHEWWDGNGYPQGLKEGEISFMARIISVTSSFHVMTCRSLYSERKKRSEALEEINNYRGTQFAPEIVDVFIKCMDK